jgi:hypothetical protein
MPSDDGNGDERAGVITPSVSDDGPPPAARRDLFAAQSQQLEKQRLEKQRPEAQRLEAQPPETQRPETQRLDAQRDVYKADQNVYVDNSELHLHGDGRGGGFVPFIRRISADDVPGFVGRTDELKWLASQLAPDAPPGGPLVLCPENNQAGIGVTALALQAASRALAAGSFPGGAVLVKPHLGGEQRQADIGRTLASVLDHLGVPLAQRDAKPGSEEAAYQRAMRALAREGRRVLIVVEEVGPGDEHLVEGLRLAGRPHRVLLTAWEPPDWIIDPRRVLVPYLSEDESARVLAVALAAEAGGRRPADRSAHLRVLARCCRGVVGALQIAAQELRGRPELSVAGLVQALGDAYDRGDAPAPDGQPANLTRSLARMVELLNPVWAPPPEPRRGALPFIGRRALLSWILADYPRQRPGAWEIIAPSGNGKSRLLEEAEAALAAAGARVVFLTMERPVESYRQRRAGDHRTLVAELARTELCGEVARMVGEQLSGPESFAMDQEVSLADQEIREVLGTRLAAGSDLTVGDALIPRGPGEQAPPVAAAVGEDCASRLREVRATLSRRVAEVLSRPPADAGRLAVLIDNLQFVTDADCRRWLAELFQDRLGVLTVVARWPGGQGLCADAMPYLLGDFTRAQTRQYLQQAGWIDPREVEPALDAIMDLTRGKPQEVAIECGRLTDLRDAGALSHAERARVLVAQACQQELGRELPVVLHFLAVLRRVNADLLSEVLATDGVTRDEAGRLAARLASSVIMTRSDDDDPKSFRIHDRIRGYLLAELPPDTLRRRHERAERVYADRVARHEPEWDPDDGDAFTVWARFEDPEVQALLREWFFHAMRSQGRSLSQDTGIRVSQVFLEAFIWWGWYRPFDVCEQLLREFEQISVGKSVADQQWLVCLSNLYRNYRLGFYYGQQEHRNWDKVRVAMEGLRRLAGLAMGTARDRATHSINVISGIYLAQATAFRDPGSDPEAAAGLFAAAREAVRRSIADGHQGSEWHDPWIVYFTGDMWSACGRPDNAAAALRELDELAAADTGGDLFDRDLAIRTTHLQAEVYLARSDYARAVDACGRAALLIYAYHVSQETPQQPPNDYTYTEHLEAIARARDCLSVVRAHDVAAWRDGIERMRGTFAPYWRLAGGREAGQYWPADGLLSADGPVLPAGIIPPPPPKGSLGRFDSPFVDLARGVVRELGSQLDNWVPFQEP